MMFGVGTATRVYLALGATDMRKGFEGLHGLVRQRLELDPLSGQLFLFCNRSRTRLKVLFWDGRGLWECAKRLEKGRFRWPQESGAISAPRPINLPANAGARSNVGAARSRATASALASRSLPRTRAAWWATSSSTTILSGSIPPSTISPRRPNFGNEMAIFAARDQKLLQARENCRINRQLLSADSLIPSQPFSH